jgi:putative PIN family toxin of toxin-antitoxin system
MRLLLDANVLVSYLLHAGADSPVTRIIESCVLGKATLLLPEALLEELTASVANKPYLNARIQPEEFARLATILHGIGETVPRIESPIPAVTRDPKDDYLLAYAVVGEADYLITGDNDLLVLQQVVGVTICTPRDFIDQWPRDEEH